MPLFLFSGTFFPISQLPALVAVDRPGDAAVARRRRRPDATLGRLGLAGLGGTGYLLVWVAGGPWLASTASAGGWSA